MNIESIYASKPFKLCIMLCVAYVLCYAFRDTWFYTINTLNDLTPDRIESFDINFFDKYSKSGYVILTKGGGQYANRDSWVNNKVNSADINSYIADKLKSTRRGETIHCDAEVSGHRIHLPTLYPNIIKITCD
jgi:hypothetical protein